MTSTASFNKRFQEFKQTYLWSLRKNMAMLILLAVLMFLSLPMILMFAMPQWIRNITLQTGVNVVPRAQSLATNYSSFLRSMVPICTVTLVLLFSVILCFTLFGYMHKKRSVDLFHALPVGRVPMLLGRWCAGITVLFVPLILNFAAVHFIAMAYGIAAINLFSSPFKLMLLVMLMGMAAFTFSMFMAVCSGTLFDTMISIVGVNVGYPLLVFLSFYFIDQILPGANLNPGGNLQFMSAFAPFMAAYLPFIGNGLGAGPLTWWLILTAAMLIGSILLYKRRKSESAENAFAFSIPKNIIRFILTGVGGLGFGLILSSVGGGGFFIGVVTGSMIAHVVTEAIYSRGFKTMKKSLIGYGIFAAVFVVFYAVLTTGFFGYDARVPNAAEVQSVTVTADTYSFSLSQPGYTEIYDEDQQYLKNLTPVISQRENIQTVISAQKDFAALYRKYGFPYRLKNSSGQSVALNYQLKNGRVFSRRYQCYDLSSQADFTKEFQQDLNKIVSIKEYIENRDLIFYLDLLDINSFTVYQLGSDEKDSGTVITAAADKQELYNALKQDFLGGKINSPDEEKNNVSVSVEFRQNITPKDPRLKQILGDYKGKININGGRNYDISGKDCETYRLITNKGWVK